MPFIFHVGLTKNVNLNKNNSVELEQEIPEQCQTAFEQPEYGCVWIIFGRRENWRELTRLITSHPPTDPGSSKDEPSVLLVSVKGQHVFPCAGLLGVYCLQAPISVVSFYNNHARVIAVDFHGTASQIDRIDWFAALRFLVVVKVTGFRELKVPVVPFWRLVFASAQLV